MYPPNKDFERIKYKFVIVQDQAHLKYVIKQTGSPSWKKQQTLPVLSLPHCIIHPDSNPQPYNALAF